MRLSPHLQRGVAFLTFVAILSAVSILFVVAQSAWQSKQRLSQLPQMRASRVAQAADAVRRWYQAHADEIDSAAFNTPAGARLLAEAGIPKQWLLNAEISAPQRRGHIQYRVLVVWGDGDDAQTPVFDPATAVLTLCPDSGSPCGGRVSARIEGYEIQAEHYATTVRMLNSLAIAAQAYFQAYWLADPDHNLSINYFRGCAAPPSKLPCIDNWEALDASGVLAELGKPSSHGFDSWGGSIEVMNGGVNDDASPYRLAFRTTTPWGVSVVVYALQRL